MYGGCGASENFSRALLAADAVCSLWPAKYKAMGRLIDARRTEESRSIAWRKASAACSKANCSMNATPRLLARYADSRRCSVCWPSRCRAESPQDSNVRTAMHDADARRPLNIPKPPLVSRSRRALLRDSTVTEPQTRRRGENGRSTGARGAAQGTRTRKQAGMDRGRFVFSLSCPVRRPAPQAAQSNGSESHESQDISAPLRLCVTVRVESVESEESVNH